MPLSGKFRVIHDSRLPASLDVVAVLQQSGHAPDLVDYARTPLKATELRHLLSQLDERASRLLFARSAHGAERAADNLDQLAEAITRRPSLLPGPIVVRGARATVADKPEHALSLLS